MKHYLILTILCFSILILNSCKKDREENIPKANIDLKKGLLAYYKFDGNTADSSGNNNHGQLLNGGQLGYDEHGNYESALDCYNHNQGMLVNNNGTIQFDTAFSVSLDVMVRDYLPNSIFNFINYSNGEGQSFSIGNNIFGDGKNWVLFVNKETNFCSTLTDENDRNQYLHSLSQYQLTESWYHLIVTFSKQTVSLYVNGMLDKTFQVPNATIPFCNQSQLVIGNYLSGEAYGLNGKMDEVRIYNRVLNNDEIKKLSWHY